MISFPRALRPLAIERDSEESVVFELRVLWDRLQNGKWVFRDTFSTSERCYALLRSPSTPQPLKAKGLEILERMLLGTPGKVVAFERRRALSSITAAAQECLRNMGLDCRASHASVLLIMAASALQRRELATSQGRLSYISVDDVEYAVVSALRPDLQFPVQLSLAEAAVLRSLVVGNSHAQISDERARSPRTVANQLATAFRKLGVSGRRATIERLLQHSAHVG